MNIQHWIEKNCDKFDSPYEHKFAEQVLGAVRDLDLGTVSCQFYFLDLDGKNRYCDFVIREGSIRIAIEVDGYDKRGTGTGMTHDEFVDWQRRQAALTAQGWHVLRFANRDIFQAPERCRRCIELLLQEQRSKRRHQQELEKALARLSNELEQAQAKAGAAEQVGRLTREISLLKKQLLLAQSAKPLTEKDRRELNLLAEKLAEENESLKELNSQLEQQSQVMDGENKTMKTTIWAFTVIIGAVITAGAYILGNQKPEVVTVPVMQAALNQQQAASKPQSLVAAVSTDGDCDNPLNWIQARKYVGREIAVQGRVSQYLHQEQSKGQPTWINIGARYPDKNRLTVVVWGEHRAKFGRALSPNLENRNICVKGTVKMHDGVPQIAIQSPGQLVFVRK